MKRDFTHASSVTVIIGEISHRQVKRGAFKMRVFLHESVELRKVKYTQGGVPSRANLSCLCKEERKLLLEALSLSLNDLLRIN